MTEEVTNPLYARPHQVIHNAWISLKDDHDEEYCSFCYGSAFPTDAMVVHFPEESTDEEDRPGSPAAVTAADGSVADLVDRIAELVDVELQPFQRAFAERVLARRQPQPDYDAQRLADRTGQPVRVAELVRPALFEPDAELDVHGPRIRTIYPRGYFAYPRPPRFFDTTL